MSSLGVLKGVSWQGCPGVLFYNREAAKEVLGSDDPAEVQKYVSDWDTFNATAEKMKAAGYQMTSSVNETPFNTPFESVTISFVYWY